MLVNYLVILCKVCGEAGCARHPYYESTGTFTVRSVVTDTIRTETGGVGPAYTFTAKELGLPERDKK